MSYWQLNEDQRSSFMGRCFRFGTIDGPQELYSFSSHSDRPTKPDRMTSGRLEPMYFMTKANLMQAVRGTSRSSPMNVFELVRQGVALCEDWNDMRWMFLLDLPAGMSVEAWFGIAKFQPRRAARTYIEAQSLSGGWLQYIVELNQQSLWLLRDPVRTGVS
jgi:hypothetical protein